MNREEVLRLVFEERDRQNAAWPKQWKPGGASAPKKLAVLMEEVGEVAKEVLEYPADTNYDLRKELVQVAAVAIAWLESMDDSERRK